MMRDGNAVAGEGKNPKSEIRNPKQIRKDGSQETTKVTRHSVFTFSIHPNLFRISSFGFRIFLHDATFAFSGFSGFSAFTVRRFMITRTFMPWPPLPLKVP